MAKYYYFTGKSFMSRILKPDVEYNCWSQPLYLNPESYDLFMKLKEGTSECEGILNEVKQKEDGYLVNFRRPLVKKFKGQEQALTPPIILDKDGLPWQENCLIGNGSDITVKTEWYTYTLKYKKNMKGSAIRLVGARIDNLIPYEMNRDFSDEEKKMTEGLPEQPKQLF